MKLNLNTDDLIHAAIAIIIGGIILLGVLTLLTPLLPIISIVVVLVLAYLLYRWWKEGKIQF